MDNRKREMGIGRVIFAIFAITVTIVSCHSCTKPETPDPDPGLTITGVSIPSSIDVMTNGTITITGNGFNVNDLITITSSTDPTLIFISPVLSITSTSFTFELPAGIVSGSYRIAVSRGDEKLSLGSTIFNIIVNTNIPDIAGMTIKGVVFADGAGIPGVAVSDGYEVVITDENGVYYLPSLKQSGFVFISLPGNYEVSSYDNQIPLFFRRLTGGSGVEQKDFSLIKTNNQKHIILTMADWHLANRNDDIAQFSNGFLLDINSVISSYTSAGTKVYGLTLGDMSWDAYWYDNNFKLPDYLIHMNKINCKIFNVMGNHDNDPYTPGDLASSSPYRELIGPTYYSFNIGNVHYVVLDNIEYLNSGASQGIIGARNYNDIIVAAQMNWLKKDLATIADKDAPLIIAMHSQLYNNPTLDAGGNQITSMHLDNGTTLLSELQSFTNVHIVSGHTHINFNASTAANIMEHNTAAVSATWWWTGKSGYAGNHICTDGSPGGYGIWEIDGNNIKWFYKGTGKPKNYQFRSYDLNRIHITAAEFAPNSTDAALAPYAGAYAVQNSGNEVLINIWGYDPMWTIDVKEAGISLPVVRVTAKDPLHIISYEAKRLNVGTTPTSSFVTGNTSHMFKVVASSSSSTLEIKVTDRFGNIYSETMTRPKQFTYLMN